MAAQIVRLSVSQLAQLGQLNRYFNGKDFSALANGAELESGLPIFHSGSIDAGGVYRAGQLGIATKPTADFDLTTGQQIALMSDSARNLNVRPATYLDWVPNGRLVFEDRFQNAISWVQAVGTVAYSAVRPYPGNPNCMRMTTGAVAGNQAQATLGLFRIADAQNRGFLGALQGDGPKIWYGVLFKNVDANLGFIELGVQLFDGVSQTAARTRLLFPSGQLQVFDGAQNSVGTPVALDTSERWHWLGMELHYQSGASTAFSSNVAYSRLRIDDTVVDFTPYFRAATIGAAAFSGSLLEITVQNNAAAAEVCDIGYVQLKDLTNVRNLLG